MHFSSSSLLKLHNNIVRNNENLYLHHEDQPIQKLELIIYTITISVILSIKLSITLISQLFSITYVYSKQLSLTSWDLLVFTCFNSKLTAFGIHTFCISILQQCLEYLEITTFPEAPCINIGVNNISAHGANWLPNVSAKICIVSQAHRVIWDLRSPTYIIKIIFFIYLFF